MNTTDERIKNLPIQRVKNILLSPTTEWPVIAAETTTPKELYLKYVMLLAAIPAVVGLLVNSVFGNEVPHFGTFRMDIGTGIAHAILQYAMSLGLVWVMAWIVDALAPKFGSESNFIQSLKLVVYAMTPGWIIVGILGFLLPLQSLAAVLALLALALVYVLHLLYIGLPIMKNPPSEKRLSYFVDIMVTAICGAIVIGSVVVKLRPVPPKMTFSEAKALQDAVMKQFEKTGDILNKKLEEAGKTK